MDRFLTNGDTFRVTTNKACCGLVFGFPQNNFKCCFVPKPLKEKYGNRYMAWFIVLDGTWNDDDKGRRFRNFISDDGETIKLEFDGNQNALDPNYDLALKQNDLLVFRKLKTHYTFVGVFNETKILRDNNGDYKGKLFARKAETIKL